MNDFCNFGNNSSWNLQIVLEKYLEYVEILKFTIRFEKTRTTSVLKF